MRRGRAIILVILLFSGALIGFRESSGGIVRADSPPAKTPSCSTLRGTTTWSVAGSPYLLTCTVVVPAGITLTIQPGVMVYGTNGASLQVQGTLLANGVDGSHIIFRLDPSVTGTWGGLEFLPGATSASSVSYADVSGAVDGIKGYPGSALSHLLLSDNNTGIRSPVGPKLSLSSVTIQNSVVGLVSGKNLANLTMDTSIVQSNGTGMSFDVNGNAISVMSSDIANNDNGVVATLETAGLTMHGNNIYGSSPYNASVSGTPGLVLDAKNNYWGSTDTATIQATIRDCNVDATRPCVTFQPLLTAPAAGAATVTPTLTNTPASTATSVGTDTPVPFGTGSPVATSTGTITVTPTAAATETAVGSDTPTPIDTTTPIPTAFPSIAPEIKIYPSTQIVGTAVSVTGGGFNPGEPITVGYTALLNNGSTIPEQQTVLAFDNGTFAVAVLPVPSITLPGDYIVTATGQQSGKTVSTTFSAVATASNTLATATVVATLKVNAAAPSIIVDKMVLLRHVNGKNVELQRVHVMQATDFIVLYHVMNAGTLKPSAALSLTSGGKVVMKPALNAMKLGHHAAFAARVTFKNRALAGTYYAHFSLKLGQAIAKGNRKFYLSAT